MPIGILGSLAICTVIYIVFSGVLTGLMHYSQLDTPKPVATALETYPTLSWLKHVVEIGAIAGLSSTMLMMLMAQPRIFYAMSQDGLLPKLLSKVHPKFQTPHVGTLIVGACACTLAGLFPISLLGDLVSMGTLLAFATVCIGIVVLRRTRPGSASPLPGPHLLGDRPCRGGSLSVPVLAAVHRALAADGRLDGTRLGDVWLIRLSPQ